MSVELLLNLDDHSKRSLQKQIVDQIAFAIMNGNIVPDQPLPHNWVWGVIPWFWPTRHC
jgi:DNA-binding GntR family transcriptional regulator